jgi:hypothetical protein
MKRHAGGRPKGSGLKKDRLGLTMRISEDLMDMINSERRDHERLSDTVMRMFRQRANRQRDLQKKVDSLEERLSQYILVSNK